MRIWPVGEVRVGYEDAKRPATLWYFRGMPMHIAGHNVPVAGLVNFIPVLATIVTTILSIVLARATLRYAHAADRTLELAHEQFEREWAPELHLRMERTAATDARLVITNLAKTSVLLQLVQLRSTDHALPFEKQYLNEPLVGGTAWTHPMGERLLHLTSDNFQGTVAASASFYCSGRLFRTTGSALRWKSATAA
jgi:cell division protein FtsL